MLSRHDCTSPSPRSSKQDAAHSLFFFLPVSLGMWDFSSLNRDLTHVPCIGRQSLNQWTAREVPGDGVLILTLWMRLAQGHSVSRRRGNQVVCLTLRPLLWTMTQ